MISRREETTGKKLKRKGYVKKYEAGHFVSISPLRMETMQEK
jgi:hypothetical protein